MAREQCEMPLNDVRVHRKKTLIKACKSESPFSALHRNRSLQVHCTK